MSSAKERRHLQRVAELGCVVCRNHGLGKTPATVHHIRTGQGMAQRSGHYLTIPLCKAHHQDGGLGVAIHAGRETWEHQYGTELYWLNKVIGELMS